MSVEVLKSYPQFVLIKIVGNMFKRLFYVTFVYDSLDSRK